VSVHSGRYGLVNGASTVSNWQINDAQNLAKAVASNTAFATASRKAIEDWTGSFKFFGHTPPVMPGESFTFSGYTAPDNDQYGNGLIYSGTALVSQFTLNFNWQSGEILNGQIDFGGHLALTTSTGAPPLDASTPVLNSIANCKVSYSTNDSTYNDLANVAQATLTITNALQTYVNSSSVVSSRVWTGRKAGIMDWNLSITQQDNDRSVFTKGDQVSWKLFVDATTFWALRFGLIKDFTGIQIARDTGAIIQQTIAVEGNAVNSSSGALGSIVKPNLSTWWPQAQS